MRRTYARPRTFDVECPRCSRVHIVPYAYTSTPEWDHKRSELRCSCGKVWIVGLALWDPGPSPHDAGGRPLDQVPSRSTLQQLRGILAGLVERSAQGHTGKARKVRQGRIRRSLAVVDEGERPEGCSCERLPEPLGYVVKAESRKGCAVHGKGD